MLSQKHLELLTAYVDGELTGRQRRRVERLVQKSPAARKLLLELGKDSRQLAALPRKLPPRDLPRRVLRQTAEVPAPVPATPSTLVPAASSGMPSWAGLVLAASVLLAITALSYWFFSSMSGPQEREHLVVKDTSPPPKSDPLPDHQPKKSEPSKENIDPPKKVEEPSPKKVEPPARWKFALADLPKKQEARDKLHAELNKETGVEIALTTHDSDQAITNLQKALGSHHIKLLVNPKLKEQIKKGKKALLYVEDLSSKEIAAIFEALAKEQKSSPVVEIAALDTLKLTRRVELAKMLKLSAKDMEPAKKTTKAGLPPETPVIPIIVADPKKVDDKTNPPNNPKSQPQLALLVAFEADGAPALAPVLFKSFRDSRKGSRPDNTMQLVIVLSEVPA